ncbi:uncharacterized protein LOC131517862 [Neofelis nebulosa]|uniref:uncharacterized protein LOC131517862 n=1 Tax=Neofelis nebulosa TaxID=61452 RepID=UPI00272D5061|nr:uncharacterized protein LOC131517862 [Neofelis nebulosa]
MGAPRPVPCGYGGPRPSPREPLLWAGMALTAPFLSRAAPGRQLCGGPGRGAGWAVDHHLYLHHALPAQRVLQRHCHPLQGEVDLLLGGGAEAHDRARLQEHDRAGGLGPAVLGGCQRCPRPCAGSRCISLLPGLLSRPLTSPPSDLTATLGLRPRPLASRPLRAASCALNPHLENRVDGRLCPNLSWWKPAGRSTAAARLLLWPRTVSGHAHPGGGGRLAIPVSVWQGPASVRTPSRPGSKTQGFPRAATSAQILRKLPTCH